MNRLSGTRVYLAGAMDRAPDHGKIWRHHITPVLKNMNIIVLDPTNKPIKIGAEDDVRRKQREIYKKKCQWNKIVQDKIIRSVDLRMVDISDFLIVALNMDEKPFGTIEEIVTANREKKVILIWAVNGKQNVPDWLFWMIPHKFIFDNFEKLIQYLRDVNSGKKNDKRWLIFNFNQGSI